MIGKLLRWFIENVFFNKKYALAFCLIFSVISFFIEIYSGKENIFSSSGTMFTLAGLFLNIKLTAHYHLKLPNGEPLGVASKHAMIEGNGTWGGIETNENKEKKVKEVESDEIWGATLMVVGTLIWGYGSYLMDYIKSIRFIC